MGERTTDVMLCCDTNSTLFTRCCHVAVSERGNGVQDCPVCGAKIYGTYQQAWARAFRKSMSPAQYAEYDSHVRRQIETDRRLERERKARETRQSE